MNDARRGAVVVDTMVISRLIDNPLGTHAIEYRTLIGSAAVVLSFQTVMELRFGALKAGWSELRRRRMERDIAELTVVRPDDAMTTVCARLRNDCLWIGHALGDKRHDGDRWIAASAIRLGCPLVSHDRLFRDTPGLDVLDALP